MEQIRAKILPVLACVITEGFLLYGVLSVVMEENWPASGRYWAYFLYLLYLLVLIKAVLQRHNLPEAALLIGCAGLAQMSRITTQTNAVLWFVAGFVIAKDLELRKVLKVDLITRIVLGLCLIFLPLLGLYPNQARQEIGGRLRDSFGWAHPNEMGLFFLMICVLWVYFRHERWSKWDTLGMLALIVFLDVFPNSRTSELCMLGILLMEGIAFLLRRKGADGGKKAAFWGSCGSAALLGGLIITGVLTYFGDRDCAWLSRLPSTLFSRATLAHDAWVESGFCLLGQMVNVYYLDMMYAYLGLHMGVLVLLLFVFLSALAVGYAWRKRDEKLQLILIVYLVYSVLEHEHFKMLSGFYPLLLGSVFWAALEELRNRRQS
ncbi:MAG: hypothetical protein K1W28_00215 [Lachnospiraceae bacterium]